MTTAATDPSEGPTGYHRHSYESHGDTWQMGHSPALKWPKSAYVCPTVAPDGGPRCG